MHGKNLTDPALDWTTRRQRQNKNETVSGMTMPGGEEQWTAK